MPKTKKRTLLSTFFLNSARALLRLAAGIFFVRALCSRIRLLLSARSSPIFTLRLSVYRFFAAVIPDCFFFGFFNAASSRPAACWAPPAPVAPPAAALALALAPPPPPPQPPMLRFTLAPPPVPCPCPPAPPPPPAPGGPPAGGPGRLTGRLGPRPPGLPGGLSSPGPGGSRPRRLGGTGLNPGRSGCLPRRCWGRLTGAFGRGTCGFGPGGKCTGPGGRTTGTGCGRCRIESLGCTFDGKIGFG